MTAPAEVTALRRIVLGWLSCTADVFARELPEGGVADIEVVLAGAKVTYIDILPERRPPCDARERRRAKLRTLGVSFAPIRTLLDCRFALEDMGVLDRRSV